MERELLVIFLSINVLYIQLWSHQDSVIISLGRRCDVAHHLRNFKLREEAFPFDWIILPFDSLCSLLLNDFEDFLDKDNLCFKNGPYADDYGFFKVRSYPHVYDTKYQILFRNDFPLNKNFMSEYDEIMEKFQRRIKRLYDTLQSEKFVYFIRRVITKEQARLFTRIIEEKFPNLDFVLVALDSTEEIKDDWALPRVINYYISISNPYIRSISVPVYKKLFKDLGFLSA